MLGKEVSSTLSHHLPPPHLLLLLSIDPESQLVELSLLTQDTKKSDVLPVSLGLPLRPAMEQKKEIAARMKRKAAMIHGEKVRRPACAGVS